MPIFVIIVLVATFYVMVIKPQIPKEPNQIDPQILSNESDYQPRPLLTAYEQKNYQNMKGYAAENGLIICPKIRLADLIEPRPEPNRSIWQKRFNMICSKHVDFVFCDSDMNVKLIVELDDSSHNRQDRQARDKFVDIVLKNSGYKIIHIRSFDTTGKAALDAILNPVTETEEKLQVRIERNGPTFEEWKEQHLAQMAQENNDCSIQDPN